MYKLIIVTADERGFLTGHTIRAELFRDIKAILEEATTSPDDFDSDEDYEDFVANCGCITGELEAVDEDGTHYTDYAPCFGAEIYAGHALFDNGELIELAAGASDTRFFLNEFYGIAG